MSSICTRSFISKAEIWNLDRRRGEVPSWYGVIIK